ncbi:MAG: penicillin-binding protein 1B, partial [Gammaproteobacteria bacterium]
MTRGRKPARSRRSGARRGQKRVERPWKRVPWLRLGLVLLLVLGLYAAWLDMRITRAFEGQRWDLPARVLARPLELYAGQRLTLDQVVRELELLRYRSRAGAPDSGTYARAPGRLLLHTRGFRFPDGDEPARRIRLRFDKDRITAVETVDGRPLRGIVRVEPLLIANIYPARREDRVLVRLDQVPPMLVDTLIAVEDRAFWSHHGVRPLAIARALLANIRAGRTVQGGSTLTQQLVKNYFLGSERSLWRKFNEALMAVLMELHYDKKEILEAYLNEIYLGQSGGSAIHGFGLGSQFYFGKRLNELAPEQIALLVAIIKGPSYYNPRRHPERARARRNLVLEIMAREGVIDPARLDALKRRPLGVLKRP